MVLQIGQILNNRYRIVKLLGQGGLGAVYRAWDINLDRPMALKLNLDTTQVAQAQFLGQSPFDAHCWVLSKDVLHEHVIGHTPQHRGKVGTDTFWLSFDPRQPPQWLHSHGGRLADAYRMLKTWRL